VNVARRTGVAAILAGALIFAGQAGELVFGSPSDAVGAAFIVLFAGGVLAFGIAFWGLRTLLRGSRTGQIATWLGIAGCVLLAAFAVQATIEVARTGDVPENFIVFALGSLLLLVADVLIAFPLQRLPIGAAWALPLVSVAGLVVALALDFDPVHDIGLFVFEGAWVALGVFLLRAERSIAVDRRPATAY
jgi:hypothetical protein